MHLRGHARDDAGRALRGKALHWYAGSRLLGTGERLRTRSLPRGRASIRLVARDSRGRTSTRRVVVRVRAPAPVVEALTGKRVVGPRARTTTLRIATSAPAVLTIAGKRFVVGPKARAVVLQLPAGRRADCSCFRSGYGMRTAAAAAR